MNPVHLTFLSSNFVSLRKACTRIRRSIDHHLVRVGIAEVGESRNGSK